MRNVLFDARWLRPGRTGVGTFALRLLEALPAPHDRFGLILPEGSAYAAAFPGFRIHPSRVDLTDHPRTEIFEQAGIPSLCRRQGYGTFVSFEARVPVWHPGLRTACFVYDLSHRNVPGSHGRKYSAFLDLTLRFQARHVDRLFTISATVQSQLGAAINTPASRIGVVYPADSGLSRIPAEPADGINAPFLLCVGATNPRKNIEVLLRAFAAFRGKHPGYRLALTGDARWISGCMEKAGSEGVANLGFVEEAQLRWLYENARALVYPSLDEGFGIPLVDAAGLGCPILCSDIPVFREVAGGGARYFDPASPQALASALEAEVMEPRGPDSPLARTYSWAESAKGFLAALGD